MGDDCKLEDELEQEILAYLDANPDAADSIDGATSAHVWSETYDRDVKDVFGVQREIAAAVADAMHVTLRADGSPRRAETSSPQAYENYLQGRHLFNRRSGSDLLNAKKHFEEAVRIDPGLDDYQWR